jgi:hypothetical protein
MNQANQQVVIQNANMTLIQIRQYELTYFQTFFANFGTQAALMIGFILSSISQVPGWDNPTDAPGPMLVFYWVTSTISSCFGMHCLVCTIFIQVYGQGLALRGPPGSMVRAIKGMIAEQEQIFTSFLIAIFSFGLQCIGMYFIMMDKLNAIITSIITGLFMIYWYRYSVRLYNKFSWSNMIIDWGENKDSEKDPAQILEELNPTIVNELHKQSNRNSDKKSIEDYQRRSTRDRDRLSSRSKARDTVQTHEGPVNISDVVSVIDGVDHLTGSNQNLDEIQSVLNASNTTQQEIIDLAKGMTFGSYLTVKERGTFGRENWVRRYFIIKGQLIFYYQDKRAFELNPEKPINKRAIDLEGYTLVAGSMNPPYPMSLVPVDPDDNRKVWRFQCDTETEFDRWIQLFAVALQQCNPDSQQGELVMIQDGKTELVSVRGDDD